MSPMGKVKKKEKHLIQFFKVNFLPIILFLTLLLLMLLSYPLILLDKFSLFTFIGDSNVSLLTEEEAIRAFEAKFNKRTKEKLQFSKAEASSSSQIFTIDLATSSAQIDYTKVYDTFKAQHPDSFLEKIQKQLLNIFSPTRIYPNIKLALDKQLEEISTVINQPYQNAEITFDETPTADATNSARIQIKPGVDGSSLDKEALKNNLVKFLQTNIKIQQLPLKIIQPKITNDEAEKAKTALENVIKEPIKLTFEEKVWILDAKQLLTLLDLETSNNSLLSKTQTNTYLKKIASEIDQKVQEGLFEFNDQTKRVSAFRPSAEGQELDIEKTYPLLLSAIDNNSSKTIALPVNIVQPKVKTADVNNLGIKELLGRGISNFAGSIPNRIYNVNLTAAKINGTLIPPGEIFSFNQTVGDISGATGFKQAYVIKEGRTVLDDGGGVCQDSTTLFRAVLNAGLPVVKRVAHAYRVGYYEQGFPPGLDATVFYPSVDFQFKNDTEHYILIQAYAYGSTLFVDLYGAPDNRIVNLTTPVVTNITPAPPDLRQDDPTLPRGVVKQVDFAARGADVSFTRTVTRNGEIIAKEVWKSFYKPWQAVYLVGTGG